jgi:hypothetical protein
MVSNSLDIEAIRNGCSHLAELERTGRPLVLSFGPAKEWILGDAIQVTLADVESLVTEVEALRAEFAKRSHEPDPLRAALVGILRADGYEVTEPGKARFADTPDGAALLERFFDGKRIDAAASDMLGEDAPAQPGDERPPWVCPNCDHDMPPGGKCTRYLDCRRPAKAAEPTPPKLQAGQFVRITDGHWAGRHAIATGEVNDVGAPCVTVVGKSITLGDAIDVERVFVVNPDVDAPADPPTKAEAPAAKARSRAPEPPKLVTEWAPDGRDFEGYAKDLGCDVARAQSLVTSFKDWAAKSEPEQKQARWGGTFKAWAKARLTNQA